MAGAWELGRPDTLVAILTRELVTTRWAFSLRTLKVPPNSNIAVYAGMPYDHARNTACEAMLQQGYEWLFFLDDDVIMPDDGLLVLRGLNLPIASGVYYRRHEPVLPCALVARPDGARQWVPGVEPGTLMHVDLVGAGCLLIHRSVLEKMPAPWFEWWSDRKDLPEPERLSEDFAFCYKARKMGLTIVLDGRVICMHAGLSAAQAPGVMAPLKLV